MEKVADCIHTKPSVKCRVPRESKLKVKGDSDERNPINDNAQKFKTDKRHLTNTYQKEQQDYI